MAMQVEDRRRASRSVTAEGPQDLNEQLDRNAHGQAVTSRALGRLRDRGWMHLDDLDWPGRARTVIDHVAVGPSGIVVVTTVHWIGAVDVRAGRVHHNGRASAAQRSCETAAEAVRSVLPGHLHRHVVPALSIVTAEPIDTVAGDVLACSTTRLETVLDRRPTVLDDLQVARTAAVLWATLSVGAGRGARTSRTWDRAGRSLSLWRTLFGRPHR